MTNPARFGVGLAFLGTLVLTFDAMLMRLSQMSGLQMMAWRGLCMGSVLILFWLLQSRAPRQEFRHLTTRAGMTIILCQFFNSLLFCFAIAIAPVAVVLFGLAAVPVFAAIFAWIILGEHTPTATWVTIALVMAGIGLAVTGKVDGAMAFDASALAGAVMGLGVAIVLALNFVTLRARPELPIALLIGCGALIAGAMAITLIGPQAMRGARSCRWWPPAPWCCRCRSFHCRWPLVIPRPQMSAF